MRITNQVMANVTIYNINQIRKRLYAAQTDLASGTRLHRPSDSPPDVVETMRLYSSRTRLERYKTNIADAKARLEQTDLALQQLVSVVVRVRELAIQGANASSSDLSRNASAEEVERLLEAAVDIANSQYAGKYLFAGTASDAPAFSIAGGVVTYNGNSDKIYREIAPNIRVEVNVTGDQLINLNLFGILKDVADHLRAGDLNALSGPDLAALNQLEDGLLGLVTQLGARQRSVELAENRAMELTYTLEAHITQTEGIDFEATLLRFNQEELAYKTALGVTARILPPSLLDFLR
ncbi:MAG: flagellar hook-associated protein FlgL [Firmicutes bacterium]|nr:flagellar hook-associated protein FlgL [Bacillota bacterium]